MWLLIHAQIPIEPAKVALERKFDSFIHDVERRIQDLVFVISVDKNIRMKVRQVGYNKHVTYRTMYP